MADTLRSPDFHTEPFWSLAVAPLAVVLRRVATSALLSCTDVVLAGGAVPVTGVSETAKVQGGTVVAEPRLNGPVLKTFGTPDASSSVVLKLSVTGAAFSSALSMAASAERFCDAVIDLPPQVSVP